MNGAWACLFHRLITFLPGWILTIWMAQSAYLSLPGHAQIIPDNTLGNDASRVRSPLGNQENLAEEIVGGARLNGNLFHSFSDFNINEGQQVYFVSPRGVDNIIGRVTGSQPSEILGTLGVDGSANLFLLNPNGIIFGPEAQLDIAGSFIASTADEFRFPDGSHFSATQPNSPPLLTVTLTPGLQLGHASDFPRGGGITNRGDLSVGDDLILDGDTLDLTGSLNAGRDLVLQGDRVEIRDRPRHPFVATSNRHLQIQGNQVLDIVALNHPDSGLFAGEQLRLRSARPIQADVHLFAGGDIAMEQLTRGLADIVSVDDPIIQAMGDVRFGSYTGASLHILAGGSVTITGDVTITGADTTGNAINRREYPDLATVTTATGDRLRIGREPVVIDGEIQVLNGVVQFSPGGRLVVDGTVTPTLDIRAGTLAVQSGRSLPRNPTGFFPNPATDATASHADITIQGQIRNPGGLVLLTNQYQPNLDLAGGEIDLQGSIDTSSFTTDGGVVVVDARQTLFTTGVTSYSFAEEGNGGSILLRAGESIETGFLDTSARSNVRSGRGGAMVLEAGGNILLNGAVSSLVSAPEGNPGNGGAIALLAEGDITTTNLFSTLNSGATVSNVRGRDGGNGGAIALQAEGNIAVGDILTRIEGAGDAGRAGPIALVSDASITTGNLFATALGGQNRDGGIITLLAEGDISTLELDTRSTTGNGVGQDIHVISQTGAIAIQGGLHLRGLGGRGDLLLDADGDILLTPGLTSTFEIDASGNGTGGNLTLISRSGNIHLDQIGDRDGTETWVFNSQADFNGSGGTIRLEADSLRLSHTDLLTTAAGVGETGRILLRAENEIVLSDLTRLFTAVNPGTTSQGGDIRIVADSLALTGVSFIDTATFGDGDAGNVTVRANQVFLDDNSGIFSISVGNGNGGEVTILAPTGSVTLTNRSNISTAVDSRSVGDRGGDITIRANTLDLTGGSQLQALTRADGDAGDIRLTIADTLTLAGIGRDGFLSGVFTSSGDANTPTDNAGRGGTILVDAGTVRVSDGAVFSAETVSENARAIGGDILLQVRSLELRNGGQVRTNTAGSAPAGDIFIRSTNPVLITGRDPFFDQRETPPVAPRQNVMVRSPQSLSETESNDTLDTAQLLTDEAFSVDRANDVNPNVASSIQVPYVSITGTGTGELSNDVYAFEVTSGTRATFDIDTASANNSPIFDTFISLFNANGEELAVVDNADISLGADGSLDSRDPYLRFVFETPGRYFLNVRNFNAGAYDLQVSLASPNIAGSTIDGIGPASGLFAQSLGGEAPAGNIVVNAPVIHLDDRGQISSTTRSGDGGNIRLNLEERLVMRQASLISATAGEAGRGGDGGNITIHAPEGFIIAAPNENSDITANAFEGSGGTINLSAQGIFNFQILTREALVALLGTDDLTTFDSQIDLPITNDITAISQTDPQASGVVAVNLTGIDPSQGLIELSTSFVDLSALVAQRCRVETTIAEELGEFTITGRGGIPSHPDDVLYQDGSLWADWITVEVSDVQQDAAVTLPAETLGNTTTPSLVPPDSTAGAIASRLNPNPSIESVLEMQGWVLDANGTVRLVAESDLVPQREPLFVPVQCPATTHHSSDDTELVESI
jgi:filamentous hemagglutinin family protein